LCFFLSFPSFFFSLRRLAQLPMVDMCQPTFGLFWNEILSWNVGELSRPAVYEKPFLIPAEFHHADDYFDSFKIFPIFAEAREKLHQAINSYHSSINTRIPLLAGGGKNGDFLSRKIVKKRSHSGALTNVWLKAQSHSFDNKFMRAG
jgi:hypothetical protein